MSGLPIGKYVGKDQVDTFCWTQEERNAFYAASAKHDERMTYRCVADHNPSVLKVVRPRQARLRGRDLMDRLCCGELPVVLTKNRWVYRYLFWALLRDESFSTEEAYLVAESHTRLLNHALLQKPGLGEEIRRTLENSPNLPGWSLDRPSYISYARSYRDVVSPKRRVHTTLRKFLLRRCGYSSISSDLDVIIGELTGSDGWIVSNDIPGVYNCVSTSCMSHNPDGCLSFLQRIGVKVVVFDNKARALLWPTDPFFVDRVYPPNLHAVFADWAADKGYRIRKNSDAVLHREDRDLVFRVRINPNEALPFLDTFRYYNAEDGILHANPNKDFDYDLGFGEVLYTNGASLRDRKENSISCTECGSEIERDESFTYDDEYYCESCYSANSWICQHCEDQFWSSDDPTYVDGEMWCASCTNRGAFTCDRCEEVGSECLVSVEDEMWCQTCADKFAHVCDDCGSLYTSNDHDNRCPDCAEKSSEEAA